MQSSKLFAYESSKKVSQIVNKYSLEQSNGPEDQLNTKWRQRDSI